MIDEQSLLLAWERGYGRAPFQQALVLLGLACPQLAADQLMNIPIGRRDAALLELRAEVFGNWFESLVNCPECDEPFEIGFQAGDITASETEQSETHHIQLDGYQIEYRLPTSRDLLTLSKSESGNRVDQLLSQCVLQIRQYKQSVELSSVPLATRQRISTAMAAADPQADVQLALECTECGHRWSPRFDIVGFLWAELSAWCQRLLAEIHLLAKSYGWSEREILTLGRWRRQIYLGMVRQ